MGYIKFQFDDLTPEEIERLEHAETANGMRAPGYIGLAIRKIHDRKYGEQKLCRWCTEPIMDDITDIFDRPALAPDESRRKVPAAQPTTCTDPRCPVHHLGFGIRVGGP